jgi:ATP-dependent Lon protease
LLSDHDLKKILHSQLRMNRKNLETDRIKLRNRYLLINVLQVTILIVSFYYGQIFYGLFAVLAFTVLSQKIFIQGRRKSFQDRFRHNVISEVLRTINSAWIYEPDNKISMRDYLDSYLFLGKFSSYRGKDLTKGNMLDTEFEYSELSTSYTVKKTSLSRHNTYSSQRTYNSPRTEFSNVEIFSGAFIKVNISRIQGRIFIFPKKAATKIKDYYTFEELSIPNYIQKFKNLELISTAKALLTKKIINSVRKKEPKQEDYADSEKLETIHKDLKDAISDLDDEKNYTTGKTLSFEQVDIGDKFFKKSFSLYSNEPTQAKAVLNQKFIEALMGLDKKTREQIYLSFTDSALYIALYNSMNLFRPRIYTSGVQFSDFQKYYSVMNNVESILKTLKPH